MSLRPPSGILLAMNRIIKISTTLLLAATAARAQSLPPVDSAFDGRGPKGFSPSSVLPVIREGRAGDVPAIGSLRPVVTEAPQIPATVELVPVAIEIVVPAGTHQPQAVADRLGRLSSGYRFSADPNFPPVKLVQFTILPFPPVTPPHNAYLVRGVLPAPRVSDLKQDASVREIYQERSIDNKGLEELVLRNGRSIRRIPGVREVYVGFDCGQKGEHYHIRPHQPAVVVVADGSAGLSSIRQEVFQAEPSLALEPIVFVQ